MRRASHEREVDAKALRAKLDEIADLAGKRAILFRSKSVEPNILVQKPRSLDNFAVPTAPVLLLVPAPKYLLGLQI